MFRLIHVRPGEWTPTVYVDRDGYTSEMAAWAAYLLARGRFLGVGRLDPDSRLVEVVIDPACPVRGGGLSPCGRAVVAAARLTAYEPRCAQCAEHVESITLEELSLELGATVRTTAAAPEHGNPFRLETVRATSERIRDELAEHVVDPNWRQRLCGQLLREPLTIDGLIDGVRRLTDRQVLDLFPALLDLAEQLPPTVRRRLGGSCERPFSYAGVAALRLGLGADSDLSR